MFLAKPGPGTLFDQGPLMPVVIVGPLGAVQTQALVDTGSSVSSVDEGLLQQVGARRTGTTKIQTVMGISAVPVYSAQMKSADGHVIHDGGGDGILGDRLPGQTQALIGRDVLSRVDFSYDGHMGAWVMGGIGDGHHHCGPSFWSITGAVVMGHLATMGTVLLVGSLAARVTGRR